MIKKLAWEKEHRFVVVVHTAEKRASAELDILAAFAKRSPDGSKFYLLKKAPKK